MAADCDGDVGNGDDMVPIIDKDFEIPEEKSEEFLNKFEETKVSEEFMEECRQSAIKTGIMKSRGNKNGRKQQE